MHVQLQFVFLKTKEQNNTAVLTVIGCCSIGLNAGLLLIVRLGKAKLAVRQGGFIVFLTPQNQYRGKGHRSNASRKYTKNAPRIRSGDTFVAPLRALILSYQITGNTTIANGTANNGQYRDGSMQLGSK